MQTQFFGEVIKKGGKVMLKVFKYYLVLMFDRSR